MAPADAPAPLPYAQLPAGTRATVVATPDVLTITFTRPSIVRYLARAFLIYLISIVGLLAALFLFAIVAVCVREHIWLSTLVQRLIRNWRTFPWHPALGVIPSTVTIFVIFTLLAWPRTLVIELTHDTLRARTLFGTLQYPRADIRDVSPYKSRVLLHLDRRRATLCQTRRPAAARWLSDLLRYELSTPVPGGAPPPPPPALPSDLRKLLDR
jgi:hypothetical protein